MMTVNHVGHCQPMSVNNDRQRYKGWLSKTFQKIGAISGGVGHLAQYGMNYRIVTDKPTYTDLRARSP